MSRCGDRMGEPDRIVAPELRHVDVRSFGEGGAIARVAKPPDHACVIQLELRAPGKRDRIGKIGNRIIPVDGQPGVPVEHDPLGGRRADQGGDAEAQGQREPNQGTRAP